MQNAIRICSLALAFKLTLVLSGCATAPTGTAKESPSPSPITAPEDANLSPEQKLFKRAYSNAIDAGSVNSICQDMEGSWYTAHGIEEFKVCRPASGYLKVGRGLVHVLWASDSIRDEKTGEILDRGILKPVTFDCAGFRMHTNATVFYDNAGKITRNEPSALGGTWEIVTPGTNLDAVRRMVCKDTTK